VEAGAHLQQAGDPAVDLGAAAGRLGDAREDLEQGRFPRAVAADDTCTCPAGNRRCKCPDDLALLDLEGDVLERLEILRFLTRIIRIRRIVFFSSCNSCNSCQRVHERVAQRVMALLGAAQVACPGRSRRVEFAQVVDADGDVGHDLEEGTSLLNGWMRQVCPRRGP
jgi:hypothetical protein